VRTQVSFEEQDLVNTEIKKIPLHDFHAERGAKFVPFAGWEMPVSYGPIIEEHLATREAVGLFDVSHMGEILVRGKDSQRFLNYALVNDVSRAGLGGATYSPICRDNGGVVDDLIAYQLSEEEFLLCVNASNIKKDFSWLSDLSSSYACELIDVSDKYGLLAIQGPLAAEVLQELVGFDVRSLRRFRCVRDKVADAHVICSRTGYTGEDGFELYCPVDEIRALAEAVMQIGQSSGLRLVGLGARDSLRLEAGFPLYGHELDDQITPLQAGLAWTVKWDKEDFMGRKALLAERAEGVKRKIIYFTLDSRRIARDGEVIWAGEEQVGRVASGGFSPILSQPIGSALIHSDVSQSELYVDLRGAKAPLLVKKPPLHKLA